MALKDKVKTALLTDMGRVRTNNEDAVGEDPDIGLLILADGMGGYNAGEVASGMATSAFIAYLSSLTNVQYSATQYAMFSSLMLLFPKFLAGFSGQYVDAHSYAEFFTATAFLGLPVLALVWLAERLRRN